MFFLFEVSSGAEVFLTTYVYFSCMQDLDDEVVYEAVELSKAVFSTGDEVFGENYDGEVEAYMLIQDLRNRVEIATMDSGGMVYPENLENFEDFDADAEKAVEFFYGVGEEGYDPESELAEVFEEAGLVEFSCGGVFYGENAFPYLMLLDEAERIVEGPVEEGYVDPFEETAGEDELEEELLEETVDGSGESGDFTGEEAEDQEVSENNDDESEEDKFSRLQGIMEDSVDSEDDLVFTESED